MERSVKTIGKEKWLSLSHRQKHTALAKFAYSCLEKKSFDVFIEYYERVLNWSPLDRYDPPKWLAPLEALNLYFLFHQKLSDKTVAYYRKEEYVQENLLWEPKYQISVVLDQVLTPYNVGSIMRLADNFGFSEIIHGTKGFNFDNSRLKRAAMGTENWIPLRYEENLPLFLKNSNIPSVALEKTKDSVDIVKWRPSAMPFNIIIGNEAYGISEEILSLCSDIIHISMKGFKNSMNLSHAFAVFAFYINNLL